MTTEAQTLKEVSAREKLIVALDVETAREARRVFEELRAAAGMFKVGSQLFTSAGPDFVRELVAEGARVFLDLKFHDIPNTVAAASREAARLGVALFNVHAAGGREMMRAAADALREEAARLGTEAARPRLIAVTVLTSADAATLEETGVHTPTVEAHVARLARLAAESGLDGVVASPHEIATVRAAVGREDFIVVTPGVRTASSAHDDQKRVMTPSEAVRAGADYLVMGRAILKAPDPARAAREIIEEMEGAKE
ncbi:MAG TPA: orotidine-5'-phosphate decarboxylase [Pyrinomonadaceae bacterium]|nr:orotidine-5'-phosphate decarboxylase [Pyrinomonadaceae bacterium]